MNAIATKRDLDALADRLRAEMERGFARALRWNVSTLIAMTGVVLAVSRLA